MPEFVLSFDLFKSRHLILSMRLFRSGLQTPLGEKAPETLSLNELKARIFFQGEQAAQALSVYHQAVSAVKLSYQMLYPRINVAALGNLLSGDAGALMQTVGSFAPFFLPSRWLEIKESKLFEKIAEYGLRMARANALLESTTLLVMYQRDLNIARYCQRHECDFMQLSEFEFHRKFVLREIALASAYHNLSDLKQIEEKDWSGELAAAKKILQQTLAYSLQDILARSWELQQLKLTQAALKQTRKKIPLTWMDPELAPYPGLGLALGTTLELNQYEMNLLVQKEFLLKQKLQMEWHELNDKAFILNQKLADQTKTSSDFTAEDINGISRICLEAEILAWYLHVQKFHILGEFENLFWN